MKLRDYIRLGWDQLKRRKVVTALCAAGIAIGSASIIVAIAFGESVTHYSEKQMGFYLKTDEISVRPMQYYSEDDPDRQEKQPITDQLIELIKSHPHVKAVAPFVDLGWYKFTVDDTRTEYFTLNATDLSVLEEFDHSFQQGYASDQENAIVLNYAATLDVRDERMTQLMNTQPMPNQERSRISYPLYQKQITIQSNQYDPNQPAPAEQSVRVVGILKKPEGMPDYMLNDRQAYVPITFAENAGLTTQCEEFSINILRVKVDSTSHVKEVDQFIQKLKLSTQTNLHQQERMQNEFVILRLIFGGAGAFILLIASISIVVAMTMSTYQRRRQIGIMKVLGANLAQIRNMFILESALLGLLGGLIGILLSYWVIWGINILVLQFAGPDSEEILFLSLWILPVGLFFAIATGILSGIYPAIKASRTDALTAIRRE